MKYLLRLLKSGVLLNQILLSEALSISNKLSRPADRVHLPTEAAIALAEVEQTEEAATLIETKQNEVFR